MGRYEYYAGTKDIAILGPVLAVGCFAVAILGAVAGGPLGWFAFSMFAIFGVLFAGFGIKNAVDWKKGKVRNSKIYDKYNRQTYDVKYI